MGVSYQETVQRPTFIAQEVVKDREVFLNGEVTAVPKGGQQMNYKERRNADMENCIKKT